MQLSNGLKVTPITNERNDVAQILDVRMWRLQVQLPKAEQTLNCKLEVRRKGKPLYTLGGFAAGPVRNSQVEVLIGMHPTNDSWEKADEIKTLTQIVGMGNSTSRKSNPFKKYNLAYGPAVSQPDGSLLLMVGSQGRSAAWPIEKMNDIALVLILKPEDIKYPESFSK